MDIFGTEVGSFFISYEFVLSALCHYVLYGLLVPNISKRDGHFLMGNYMYLMDICL